MEGSSQDTPARLSVGASGRVAPALVGLQELDVSDIVKFGTIGAQEGEVGWPPGKVRRARNSKVERLLAVGAVTAGYVMADEQRQVVHTQIFLEESEIDAFFGKDLLFGAVDGIG